MGRGGQRVRASSVRVSLHVVVCLGNGNVAVAQRDHARRLCRIKVFQVGHGSDGRRELARLREVAEEARAVVQDGDQSALAREHHNVHVGVAINVGGDHPERRRAVPVRLRLVALLGAVVVVALLGQHRVHASERVGVAVAVKVGAQHQAVIGFDVATLVQLLCCVERSGRAAGLEQVHLGVGARVVVVGRDHDLRAARGAKDHRRLLG